MKSNGSPSMPIKGKTIEATFCWDVITFQNTRLSYTCVHNSLCICKGSPVSKKHKVKQDPLNEQLHFGSLIPFKNHEDGMKAFLYTMLVHFQATLHPSILLKH